MFLSAELKLKIWGKFIWSFGLINLSTSWAEFLNPCCWVDGWKWVVEELWEKVYFRNICHSFGPSYGIGFPFGPRVALRLALSRLAVFERFFGWLNKKEEILLEITTPMWLTSDRMCSFCLTPLPKLEQLNVLNLKWEELYLLLIGWRLLCNRSGCTPSRLWKL